MLRFEAGGCRSQAVFVYPVLLSPCGSATTLC